MTLQCSLDGSKSPSLISHSFGIEGILIQQKQGLLTSVQLVFQDRQLFLWGANQYIIE